MKRYEFFMILRRYPSLFEAELAKSILESYNIYAEVLDKNLAFSLYGATISQCCVKPLTHTLV
ncbi:hypothetical protein HMPREF2660_01310 [Weeksella sp. HMSC059D05]|nr:hypothetical protein HMPREF2660_01310 [Weeksella sp. HMSC059D05]